MNCQIGLDKPKSVHLWHLTSRIWISRQNQ